MNRKVPLFGGFGTFQVKISQPTGTLNIARKENFPWEGTWSLFSIKFTFQHSLNILAKK